MPQKDPSPATPLGRALESRGLSISRVASRAYLDRTTVLRLASGTHTSWPLARTLVALGQVLELSPGAVEDLILAGPGDWQDRARRFPRRAQKADSEAVEAPVEPGS